VAPPLNRGFGTRLIQDSLARELAGQARLDFRPDGLRCEISFHGEPLQPDEDQRGPAEDRQAGRSNSAPVWAMDNL
jgi:hypothetical protein